MSNNSKIGPICQHLLELYTKNNRTRVISEVGLDGRKSVQLLVNSIQSTEFSRPDKLIY